MPKTHDQSADATAVVIRTGATRLKAIEVKQRTFDAPILHLKLYNDATVNVAADPPRFVFPVPAGRAQIDAQVYKASFSGKEGGIIFDTALTYAVAVEAVAGATAPTAGDEPEVVIQ